MALTERLSGIDPPGEYEASRPLRVLPLENTQSHALTCTKATGSLGHHFRNLADSDDKLVPDAAAAIAAMERMEWVGLTDLFEPSLCLLHFQANGKY